MIQVVPIRPKNASIHRRVSLAQIRPKRIADTSSLASNLAIPESHYDASTPTPIPARTQALLERARLAQDAIIEGVVSEANLLYSQKDHFSRLYYESRQQKTWQQERERQLVAREREDRRRRELERYYERQRVEHEKIQADIVRREQEIERRNAEFLERQRQREQERRAREEAEAEARRIAEEARRIEEEIRRREEEEDERLRRARLRECAVCMEEADMDVMVQVPCLHWYCVEDLDSRSPSYVAFRVVLTDAGAFQNAFEERRAFQCCRQDVPIAMLPILQPDFQWRYEYMVLEQRTPNPVYCANRNCGFFIPPENYDEYDAVVCPFCNQPTCRICRQPGHDGVCPEDIDMQTTVGLAQRRGWRRCPNCRNMVEKIAGCNHMSCRCGGHFCYVCGVRWGTRCGHG